MHAIIHLYKSESKHSEMGPVRQKLIQRTVRSVHMCVHQSGKEGMTFWHMQKRMHGAKKIWHHWD